MTRCLWAFVTLLTVSFAWTAVLAADVVIDGNEEAAAIASQVQPAVYGRPPDPQVRAQTALAVFEAVNAVERRYTSYLGVTIEAPKGASAEAAAAAAAHAVLLAHSPDKAAVVDQVLALQLSQIRPGPDRDAGLEVGRQAATLVMARAGLRQGMVAEPYRPVASPGVYVPTELPVLSMTSFIAAPWFLRESGEVTSPGGPPALTSALYARDWDEVRRLGAKASTERTPAQTAQARVLSGHDWIVILRPLAAAPGRTLSQNARLYALVAMAAQDANLSVAVAKYNAGFWRPITAIRNADQDGNDATGRDGGWEPLLPTPTHPEFPCGHCITAAAVAGVLAAEFGDAPAQGVCVTHPSLPGVTMRYASFTAYSNAVADSRIYAGVHFRFSNAAAQEMGGRIARLAVERGPKPRR